VKGAFVSRSGRSGNRSERSVKDAFCFSHRSKRVKRSCFSQRTQRERLFRTFLKPL
jgi:hypothetical protein